MCDLLSVYRRRLEHAPLLPLRGRVQRADGQALHVDGISGRVGEVCEVRGVTGETHEGQIIGFEQQSATILLTGAGAGIRYGDEVVAMGHLPMLAVGDALLGRVVDAKGEAIDDGGPVACTHFVPLEPVAPRPFARVPIDQLLTTGVRAIDSMLPVGQGQRVGIFGGSGVGKSTLLGMVTRNCDVDVVVIGLVGERGREVLEFLNESLGEAGRARSVVVVGTSDEAPLVKMRAALSATSVAEYFAARGQRVLLILDSLSRFAMAARELGLAAGEPPTHKGYTPSVFSRLARLIERAGRFQRGSITAFYTVLMEGDDEQDPIVDAVRSFVDGHIMLSRELALEGWYPPIDSLRSVSRLMTAVASPTHLAQAAGIRKQLAVFARSEDLIRIGAYKPGMDRDLDQAMAMRPQVKNFLRQAASEVFTFDQTMAGMQQIALQNGAIEKTLS